MKKETIKSFIRDFTFQKMMFSDTVVLDKNELAIYFDCNERMIRKAFSELRSEGMYFFNIKKNKYAYAHGDKMIEYAEKYLHTIISSIKTMYYNDVITLKPIVKDVRLRNIIGQLSMMDFLGENNETAREEE